MSIAPTTTGKAAARQPITEAEVEAFQERAQGRPRGLDYHFEEFKALKAEVAELVKSSTGHLPYALLASGAIYGWLLTAKCADASTQVMLADLKLMRSAWLIPLFISLCFGLLALAAYLRIKQYRDYLMQL